MEIIIQPTPEEATGIAARIIARLLREKPDACSASPPAAPRCVSIRCSSA